MPQTLWCTTPAPESIGSLTTVGRLVPDSESQKLYDNVPQKAGAQSITASRLMYGDYEEGYPNHSIHTDATMSVVYGNTPGGSTQYVASGATAQSLILQTVTWISTSI